MMYRNDFGSCFKEGFNNTISNYTMVNNYNIIFILSQMPFYKINSPMKTAPININSLLPTLSVVITP